VLDRMAAGDFPPKHHIVFEGPEGLRHEECITRQGFDGPYTIAYHVNRPQTHRPVETKHGFRVAKDVGPRPLRKRHFKSQDLKPAGGPAVDARVPMLFNADVELSVHHPDAEDPVYFANGDGDDVHYVFRGTGTVRTLLGDLRYEPDDYIVIPKGILHRFLPDSGVEQYFVTIECKGGVGLPKQWRLETGQLRMDAPFCHRDFRRPEFRGPLDEGIRETLVKRAGQFDTFVYEHSPLDVVGWDGSCYPYIFPMLNFQPRAGLVHLPPDWHGTFATRGALICSFVPRTVDFHEKAIPCPYPHASVDCDEVLFYCKGNFTSRRGVAPGSLSYHPMGIAHGPHPGAYEASIGAKETSEQAVMMDTFLPLHMTEDALAIEDDAYHASFL
jgi:homogentisate 1,2-dioxygenase